MSRGGVGGGKGISQLHFSTVSLPFPLSSFVRILATKAGGSLNTRVMETLRRYLRSAGKGPPTS